MSDLMFTRCPIAKLLNRTPISRLGQFMVNIPIILCNHIPIIPPLSHIFAVNLKIIIYCFYGL